EPGPVAGGRRIDDGPRCERAANGAQIVKTLAAAGAVAEMRGDARARELVELAVEIQLDVGRLPQLAVHARPPAVTRMPASAARRRWTAACSCRLTVPSARPSASAISDSSKPSGRATVTPSR